MKRFDLHRPSTCMGRLVAGSLKVSHRRGAASGAGAGVTERDALMNDNRPGDRPRSSSAEPFRIAGFPIRANVTVWVLFAVITYTTAVGLLPASAPGASSAAYWTGGFVAAALLLGSLLAHELAHAILARRYGIAVEAVTFWLFGGVAQLKGNAPTPKAEWRIAAIGPAVNFVLAGIGLGVGQAMSALSVPTLGVAVVGYFVMVNVLLGAFNLLPAAPLDGGRVLRSVLWRRSRDRDRATVVSSRTGQVIAAILVVAGFAELLLASSFGGMWTALVGFFLFNAAGAEARETVTRNALDGLRVRDLLPPGEPKPSAPAWHTVAQFLEKYRSSGETRTVLPVQGFDGAPAGLISLGHLGSVPAEQRDTVRLSAIATPVEYLAVTHPDEALVDLLPRLSPKTRNLAAVRFAGHALVLRDDHVVGVITPADLARAIEISKLTASRPSSDVTPASPQQPTDDGPVASAPRHLVS